ncbi:AsnC family transcriptional regulator [Candidatus Woesearchaeota archaeon]|nr:AsnC family transcriptional regulator [Candidatus Woesearchaeota archaeon]
MIKMSKLDKKACLILNLLQQDCRMSFTDIAEKVGLSVDSVKKRISKMKQDGIFYPKVQLRPRHFGFPNLMDVRIKLHNYTSEELNDFVEYLRDEPKVAEAFSLSGEWDFALVMLSKDADDLVLMSNKIRDKFSKIINTWSSSLTTRAWKFEDYDMLKLMGYDQEE